MAKYPFRLVFLKGVLIQRSSLICLEGEDFRTWLPLVVFVEMGCFGKLWEWVSFQKLEAKLPLALERKVSSPTKIFSSRFCFETCSKQGYFLFRKVHGFWARIIWFQISDTSFRSLSKLLNSEPQAVFSSLHGRRGGGQQVKVRTTRAGTARAGTASGISSPGVSALPHQAPQSPPSQLRPRSLHLCLHGTSSNSSPTQSSFQQLKLCFKCLSAISREVSSRIVQWIHGPGSQLKWFLNIAQGLACSESRPLFKIVLIPIRICWNPDVRSWHMF